jgi:serine protease AprX
MRHRSIAIVFVLAAALVSAPPAARVPAGAPAPVRVIVQARDLSAAALAVAAAGGTVTHQLPIIEGVGAVVTPAQLAALRHDRALRVFPDRGVALSGTAGRATAVPAVVGAEQLHGSGVTGRGVTIAFVDTGWGGAEGAQLDTANQPRILAGYNALKDETGIDKVRDRAGHGSHVLSVAVSSNYSTGPTRYNGVAPDASVVVVQAFDDQGWGTYSSVIRAIDWVVANRALYNIRILNCSFGAPPRSHYWEDPLNQAIMRAWQAGIVVVTSAGNTGPSAQTVRVPGNVPYVITVGAMSDNFTPDDPSDDRLASFSAVGPTWDRFVKPEVVAPGGHALGLLDTRAMLSRDRPQLGVRDLGLAGFQYYSMSGTSQAAAVVTGTAALMLQAHPELTPDDVKCRLLSTARPAVNSANQRAYTVFQQGAGLISAPAAVASTATGCANAGLSVSDDLSGARHFSGRARRGTDGVYTIDGFQGDGAQWNGALQESGGVFLQGDPWTDVPLYLQGDPWTDTQFAWPEGYPWSEDYLWSTAFTETISVNIWVPEE